MLKQMTDRADERPAYGTAARGQNRNQISRLMAAQMRKVPRAIFYVRDESIPLGDGEEIPAFQIARGVVAIHPQNEERFKMRLLDIGYLSFRFVHTDSRP